MTKKKTNKKSNKKNGKKVMPEQKENVEQNQYYDSLELALKNTTEVKTKIGNGNYTVKQKIMAYIYILQSEHSKFGITDKDLVSALNKNRQQQINSPRNDLIKSGQLVMRMDKSQIQKLFYVGDYIENLALKYGISALDMAYAIKDNTILLKPE